MAFPIRIMVPGIGGKYIVVLVPEPIAAGDTPPEKPNMVKWYSVITADGTYLLRLSENSQRNVHTVLEANLDDVVGDNPTIPTFVSLNSDGSADVLFIEPYEEPIAEVAAA